MGLYIILRVLSIFKNILKWFTLARLISFPYVNPEVWWKRQKPPTTDPYWESYWTAGRTQTWEHMDMDSDLNSSRCDLQQYLKLLESLFPQVGMADYIHRDIASIIHGSLWEVPIMMDQLCPYRLFMRSQYVIPTLKNKVDIITSICKWMMNWISERSIKFPNIIVEKLGFKCRTLKLQIPC